MAADLGAVCLPGPAFGPGQDRHLRLAFANTDLEGLQQLAGRLASLSRGGRSMTGLAIDPLTALGVVLATAATDAVYVLFTTAVVARRRVSAASWSSLWYLLSSYAVISYTENWL